MDLKQTNYPTASRTPSIPHRLGVMPLLIDSSTDKLLEDTSRSFFLTLKILPKKIRGQVGLLYLLARIADTIADSKIGGAEMLIESLNLYEEAIKDPTKKIPDLEKIASLQEDLGEQRLLRNVPQVVSSLSKFNSADKTRMLRCLGIIIEGQKLDLERFGPANDSQKISALQSPDEMDNYAYSVAGSVGEFWTSMTLAHLVKADGPKEEKMFELGVRFGKALQMINILRDIPEDLRFGRCYIPEKLLKEHGLEPEDLLEPINMHKFRDLYNHHLDITNEHLKAAEEYILMLPSRQLRLRIACLLPVLIGQKTVNMLRTRNVLDSSERVKVPRKTVKRLMIRSVFSTFIPGGVARLLKKNRAI